MRPAEGEEGEDVLSELSWIPKQCKNNARCCIRELNNRYHIYTSTHYKQARKKQTTSTCCSFGGSVGVVVVAAVIGVVDDEEEGTTDCLLFDSVRFGDGCCF